MDENQNPSQPTPLQGETPTQAEAPMVPTTVDQALECIQHFLNHPIVPHEAIFAWGPKDDRLPPLAVGALPSTEHHGSVVADWLSHYEHTETIKDVIWMRDWSNSGYAVASVMGNRFMDTWRFDPPVVFSAFKALERFDEHARRLCAEANQESEDLEKLKGDQAAIDQYHRDHSRLYATPKGKRDSDREE